MIFCNVNIPYYGKGKFLYSALIGVLKQSISDISLEITIFDDYAKEPAKDHIMILPENCYHIIRNNSNIGMIANWNRCLQYGDKEFVHILHGDDLIESGFYSKVLYIFDKNPEVGLVHTNCLPLYSRKTSSCFWGALIRRRPKEDNEIKFFPAGDDAVRHTMGGIACSSAVLRRKAIFETGLFRDDLPYSADEEYWGRLAKKWAVAYIPEQLSIYRYHSNNHQLNTWLKTDFWHMFIKTRMARLCHLTSLDDKDIENHLSELSHLAVFIAHKLLAAGYPNHAESYLECAFNTYPWIINDLWYRRIQKWVCQGEKGKVKAWLRSPH